MKLSDKILSLLKEKDYSFEELKEKTNSSFFELRDNIKNLLKEKKVFRKGFPTKYALHKSSEKVFLSKTITNSTRTLEDYKGVFLTTTILLLMVILYSVFLKNPFVYPGLEQRTFIVFLPSLLITILLYTPWQKIIRFIPINFVQEKTLLFLDKAKSIASTNDLKHFLREFLNKILLPYYPHLLIILSVFSLFKIQFFSSFNTFFSPIALPLILISIILIILKQSKPFFFKEKEFCKYAFLFLLILVTLSSLSFEIISFISEPLKAIQFQLTIFTIILGAITFYQNKSVIEEIEAEQSQEEKEEDKRAKEFSGKYPKLAGIPVLNFVSKRIYKEGIFYSIIFILCVGSFLGFGMIHLGQFMSVDEPKWVNTRVPQLYEGLAEMDWGKTYINDKPGILPAFLSGFVNFFLDHEEYKSQPLIYEFYLFWWRLPILVFNFLMLFLIYHFSKKLFDKAHASLILILIALNPILIGISQIVNPDATLWSVGFLAFLTFFLYLKNNNQKYIYLSGIFFGLALISKYFITILYPLFFIILYLEYLLNKTNKEQFFDRCLDLLKLYFISILIYAVFFPVNWINPEQILKGTIGAGILSSGIQYVFIVILLIFIELLMFKGKISDYFRKFDLGKILIFLFSLTTLVIFIALISNILLGNAFFDFNQYRFFDFERGQVNIINDFVYSMYATLFSLIYPLLFGLFLFVLNYFSKPNEFYEKNKLVVISCFLAFFIITFGSTLGGFVASVRYQIFLYSIYAILASLLILKFSNSKKIISIVFLISIATLFFSVPFYFHYENELNINNYAFSDAWGFGGYELAQIMNQKENAENIVVWSDREGFNEFFVGKSYWRGKDNPFDEKYSIDYLILTTGREFTFKKHLIAYNAGKRYLYARVAAETPLLENYTFNYEEKVCIQNNINNCVWSVKIKK